MQVSAFVALEDLSQVAVGFANGSVTVVRGDFIHDRGTKQRIVFESEDPITALEVREGAVTILYIATTGRLSNLVISGKGQGQPARTIDNLGCGVGCMTTDPSTRDIIIARDDAIYSYGAKGRGASFAFEGPKKIIKMYKSYVSLVRPPRVAQVSKSKTFRRLGADEVDALFTTTSFCLLDTDLRYVAHNEQLSSQVKHIFVEWGELYIITEDGKVCSEDVDPTHSLELILSVVPLPREIATAEARDPIRTKLLHTCYQSRTKGWNRQNPTKYYLPEVWRLPLSERRLRHCDAAIPSRH